LIAIVAQAQLPPTVGYLATYNNPLAGIGAGIGFGQPFGKKLALNSKLKVFPGLGNNIQEASFGIDLNIHPIKKYYQQLLSPYVVIGVNAGYWFNYVNTLNTRAKQLSIIPNTGLGLEIKIGEAKIYSEFTLNPILGESFSEIGIRLSNTERFNRNRRLKNSTRSLKCPPGKKRK
jgi:hypothetical protein